MNNEIEDHMVRRFLEMRKQLDQAEAELDRKREDVSNFGYLAALQFPDFIDRVCENSTEKHVSAFSGEQENSPRELIHFLLMWRAGYSLVDADRRKGETSRQWMARIESAMLKKLGKPN